MAFDLITQITSLLSKDVILKPLNDLPKSLPVDPILTCANFVDRQTASDSIVTACKVNSVGCPGVSLPFNFCQFPR